MVSRGVGSFTETGSGSVLDRGPQMWEPQARLGKCEEAGGGAWGQVPGSRAFPSPPLRDGVPKAPASQVVLRWGGCGR